VLNNIVRLNNRRKEVQKIQAILSGVNLRRNTIATTSGMLEGRSEEETEPSALSEVRTTRVFLTDWFVDFFAAGKLHRFERQQCARGKEQQQGVPSDRPKFVIGRGAALSSL
jgi:hypothetical protein